MTRQEQERSAARLAYAVLGTVLFFLLFFGLSAHAQEQYIRQCAQQAACTLTPVGGTSWAAPVQTYMFTPIQPNVSLRIWVHNNNPTSAHTAQAMSIWVTNSTRADISLINLSDLWVQGVITSNVTPGADCLNTNRNQTAAVPGANGMGTCYSVAMYAAQVAIRFTPGGAQAGVPDTFDIGVVQQPSNVPSGPQPGDRQYEVAGELPAAQGAPGTNPLLIGCETGIQSIPTATGQNQYVSCDILGDLSIVGPTGSGTSFTGLNPVVVGNVESSSLVRPIAGQSAASVTTSSTSGQALLGISVVTAPADWTVATQAAGASQCVASLALQAGTRHCATGVSACVSPTIAQAQLFANLRDGATGAGTVKWNGLVAGPAAGSSVCVTHEFSGGPICGTAGTAMTLELSAATGAGNGCATTVKGYDVN
jgi:hypothetical protein